MAHKLLAAIACSVGIALTGSAIAAATPQAASNPAEPTTETITLKIEGWTCPSCERGIRKALLAVPGVQALEVSYARGGAIVTVEAGRVSPEQLVQAVEQASTVLSTYRAVVVPNGTLTAKPDSNGMLPGWLKEWFK